MALAKQYGTSKKARAAIKKGASGGADYLWRLKADEQFTVRYLQEPKDWYEAAQHYVAGEFVWCSDPDGRKSCESCQSGNSPSKRVLTNVLDRESGKVRIIQMTSQLADSVAGKIDRPITTADYTIWREGSTKENTTYGADRLDPTRCDLSRYTLLDVEAAIVAELGFDPGGEEPEDEEPRSSKPKSKSRPTRRSREEPEEEDDYEDDEEEDDEEEPEEEEEYRPRRKPARTSSASPPVKKKRPAREDGYDEFKPEKSRHPEASRVRKLRK